MPDAEFGYTPLAYAILLDAEIESRTETQKNLEDDSEVVRLILEFNPKSLQVLSRDGYSPLELHIMAMSQLKRKDSLSQEESTRCFFVSPESYPERGE